jgi:hypothetical protein
MLQYALAAWVLNQQGRDGDQGPYVLLQRRQQVSIAGRWGANFDTERWVVDVDVFFQSFQSEKKVHMLILAFSTITYSIVILGLAKVIFLQNVCILFVCGTLFNIF